MTFTSLNSAIIRWAISFLFILAVTSCSQQKQETSELQLPISLNEVMVALVNQAADPIWVAAWRNPQTDRDWRNLEYLGYQLEVAGALLTIPGTGPYDKEWVSRPEWPTFASQLKEAGILARDAARDKDLVLLNTAGDRIVEVCESCHTAYKLTVPTGGLFGELSPTPPVN